MWKIANIDLGEVCDDGQFNLLLEERFYRTFFFADETHFKSLHFERHKRVREKKIRIKLLFN